jgi:phosphoenolpyruvate-protein kinase (PTS system EI component)
VTGCSLVRLVAAIVLAAGVIKTWDVLSGEPSAIQYSTGVLVGIGVSEMALAAWALRRPRHRLPALGLAGFLLAVTLYLLTVPPR